MQVSMVLEREVSMSMLGKKKRYVGEVRTGWYRFERYWRLGVRRVRRGWECMVVLVGKYR